MKKRKKNLRQILIPAFIITACIPLAIFALISQERLKTSTLENMNNQAEADLQKANQSLNMTLDKYETLLYAITTDEEFLSLVVNANDSEEIPEADAYNMRRDFAHICNRNEGVDGIQLVLSDKRRIFYDRLSSSSVNSTWMEKVKIPDETKLLSYDVDKDTDNPERMFHIGRKVVNYWDISEDLGYVILSVNLDELESVLSAGKGSRVYLVKDGVILNDETLPLLAKASVSYAKAGADIIAPSDMMDLRVKAIREALDEAGFVYTPIMSYSAKFASGYYGPFRDAAHSAPGFGDRKTYQMDPANGQEAMREIGEDIKEGADLIIAKPALAYMDIMKEASMKYNIPIVAYNVSGEYAMVKAAAANGWIDEKKIVMENMVGLKRAGAKMIITYHALDVAKWLKEEER